MTEPTTAAGQARYPVRIKVYGGSLSLLPPGTVWRVERTTEHVVPSGTIGEPMTEWTLIDLAAALDDCQASMGGPTCPPHEDTVSRINWMADGNGGTKPDGFTVRCDNCTRFTEAEARQQDGSALRIAIPFVRTVRDYCNDPKLVAEAAIVLAALARLAESAALPPSVPPAQDEPEVYVDRNLVVQALAQAMERGGYQVWWGEDKAEPDWPVLYVETDQGQVSWHIPKAERLYEPPIRPEHGVRKWDGHTTPEKFGRLRARLHEQDR